MIRQNIVTYIYTVRMYEIVPRKEKKFAGMVQKEENIRPAVERESNRPTNSDVER